MAFQRVGIPATTDAAGAATVYSPNVDGEICAIHWIKPGSGGITGATFTMTVEGTAEAVLTASSVSSSAAYYPRGPVHTVANVAQLYAAAGLPVTDKITMANDRLKIVIASGGNTLTGTFVLILK